MEKFEVGTVVRLVDVDRFGFLGRDLHPFAGVDEGFTGVVVRVELEGCVESGLSVEETDQPPTDPLYIYRVCDPRTGRCIDLMSHEIVAHPVALDAKPRQAWSRGNARAAKRIR